MDPAQTQSVQVSASSPLSASCGLTAPDPGQHVALGSSIQPQVSSNAANLLKKCATDPLWFYDAKSPEQLAQSYRDIALKLSALYLAK